MVHHKVNCARKINIVVILVVYASSCYSLNVGLLPIEFKRLNPLVIKKFSQNSPVFINIKSENQQPPKGFLQNLPLPSKPPPMKRSEKKLKSKKKFPRSIFTIPKLPFVSYMIPMIPKLPILPIFPWIPSPTRNPSIPLVPPLAKVNKLISWDKRNTQILEKLMDLKHKGRLTTAEYYRFKHLLIQ